MSEIDPPNSSPPVPISPREAPSDETHDTYRDDTEELALAKEIVEVEKRRLDIEKGRLDVVARAIEVDDQRDRRIAEFHGRRLELADSEDVRHVRLAYRLLGSAFLVVVPTTALILYMAFWGDEAQRQMATNVGTIGAIGVAGYGLLTAVARGIRSLFERQRGRQDGD